jgi:phosphatidylserine/phosphatidylglycerophosphate/cardiolipin synthase-like enzyme
MLRLLKRLRASVTFLLTAILLMAGGFTFYRLGDGASPEDLKKDLEQGVSAVRSEDGFVVRFVRRALRPVANPGETLAAVRDGISDARKEVSQWTREQRRSLTDGRERIKEIAQANQQPPGTLELVLGQAQEMLGAASSRTAPATQSIQVYFTPSAERPMDKALLEWIARANTQLDCACFELDWMPMAAALVDARARGVQVRLVIDGEYRDSEGVQFLLEEGISIEFEETSNFMHNKFCVADAQRVWTGSANFTENGLFGSYADALAIESSQLAANYRTEFNEMFERRLFGASSPRDTPYNRIELDGIRVENYFAPEDRVKNEIISEIAEARRRIDFMMFSFTSEPIAEALLMRMLGGIRVRGIFEALGAESPNSRDNFLAERGAEIYIESDTPTFHYKLMIIDETTVLTGSYNYSARAEEKNDENIVIIESREIARQYLDVMESFLPRK